MVFENHLMVFIKKKLLYVFQFTDVMANNQFLSVKNILQVFQYKVK